MSDLRRLLKSLVVVFFLLLITGCAAQTTTVTLAQLEYEGIIAPFDPGTVVEITPTLTQVVYGDLIQNWMVPVNVVFPRTYHMHFEAETFDGTSSNITFQAWQNGYFSGMPWRAGDSISAGDFIAELSFYESEAINIERFALSLEKDQFEISFQNERQNRRQEINNLRNTSDTTGIYSLRISRMELEYRQFLYRSQNTRQNFETRLYNLNTPTRAERLYAPISGRITYNVPAAESGMFRDLPGVMPSPVGRRIVTIVDYTYPHFLATPMHLYVLRYGDIVPVQIIGQDVYFHATVVVDPMVQNIRRVGSHQTRLIPVCEDEFNAFVYELAYLEIDLATATLHAHPSVPLALGGVLVENRAVTSEGHRNFVMLYENGSISRRDVELGPSFGLMVQILSGLSPGQQVVLP
ncbi:MAG: hypothetical protein FWC92_05700 [Defluviitaleaceae bacterium]|nr:hypothetical protein [Defluviitaleaceae bacterium]